MLHLSPAALCLAARFTVPLHDRSRKAPKGDIRPLTCFETKRQQEAEEEDQMQWGVYQASDTHSQLGEGKSRISPWSPGATSSPRSNHNPRGRLAPGAMNRSEILPRPNSFHSIPTLLTPEPLEM